MSAARFAKALLFGTALGAVLGAAISGLTTLLAWNPWLGLAMIVVIIAATLVLTYSREG